ncbi:MAG TPA: cyclic nucleotide-binding domain-containing protein [Chitinophagaceae bacterium]|nr:cyclic nucleotide-binding domain-containing protein [Chitinophagaceae bacterium]
MDTKAVTGLLLIERVLLLKSLSIFRDTPENILAEIVHLMVEVQAHEGKAIVREGEPGNCMYIIQEGKVSVKKQHQLLASLGEKEFFGELSLLDTETRSATVVADSDCILFRIDQEPFYDLMESRPEVVRELFKILSKRIRSLNQQLLGPASR